MRAECALADVHGSLVEARGNGEVEVLCRMLARLRATILG